MPTCTAWAQEGIAATSASSAPARRRGNAEDKAFWDRALNPDTQKDEDLTHAIHLIRSTGAAEDTFAEARSYIAIAKKAMKALPPSEFIDALADLADFCVERAY